MPTKSQEDPLLMQALDILNNGGTIPKRVTNSLVAAMLKELYARVSSNGSDLAECKVTLAKIDGSPSLLYFLKYQTGKTIAFFTGSVVFMITTWFFLHLLAHVPTVEEWFIKLLGLS